ncbi:metal-binding protein, partial [Pseudomonas helmanticensis]
MLNDPIPPHVDPRKLADRGTTLQGELLIEVLKRLWYSIYEYVCSLQYN